MKTSLSCAKQSLSILVIVYISKGQRPGLASLRQFDCDQALLVPTHQCVEQSPAFIYTQRLLLLALLRSPGASHGLLNVFNCSSLGTSTSEVLVHRHAFLPPGKRRDVKNRKV